MTDFEYNGDDSEIGRNAVAVVRALCGYIENGQDPVSEFPDLTADFGAELDPESEDEFAGRPQIIAKENDSISKYRFRFTSFL